MATDPTKDVYDHQVEKNLNHGHHDYPKTDLVSRGDTAATAKIQNVLHGQPKEQVIAEVDAFCEKFGLQADRDIFRKGALLAQRPHEYQFIEELSEADKEIVAYEHAHKWHYPKMLYFAVFMCAIGAATQGWDQTGSNGANLSFPTEFGIATPVGEPGGESDEWKVGAINGAPYIGSALLGCWLSDPLNHWFGRRGEIFLTSLILIATPIASGFTHHWSTLFVVRLILGIGMGAKAATVPMYAAELSPAVVRGALVMGWQLWTAFGIFLGTCANAVVKDVPDIAWRLQLGSAFIPALPLAIGIFFCPESPRWYMKKGRLAEAWQSMKRLRSTELQASRDLYYAYVQFAEEMKIVQGANYFTRLAEIFTIPRARRATLAAGTVMIAQQMCGINIMAFYSSTIFVESGFNQDQALYASIGFGALNFAFAIPAIFTIDTFGRRSLLLATFPNMAWTLFVAGGCLYIDAEKVRLALVALFVYLFTIAYSVGEGPVPFMYSAEVFPLVQREQGMAFAVAWTFFWAAILGLTFPRMLRAFTPPGAFFFYGGLNIVALILIFLFVPETKQLTLEELDNVFEVPTATYSKHQVTKSLPWFFKRYVLRQKSTTLQPLFAEDNDVKI